MPNMIPPPPSILTTPDKPQGPLVGNFANMNQILDNENMTPPSDLNQIIFPEIPAEMPIYNP